MMMMMMREQQQVKSVVTSSTPVVVTCIEYSVRHRHILLCTVSVPLPPDGSFRTGRTHVLHVSSDAAMDAKGDTTPPLPSQLSSSDHHTQQVRVVASSSPSAPAPVARRCVWSERYAGWAALANVDGSVSLLDANSSSSSSSSSGGGGGGGGALRPAVRTIIEEGHAATCVSWNHLLPELLLVSGESGRVHMMDVHRMAAAAASGARSQHRMGRITMTDSQFPVVLETFSGHSRPVADVQWNTNSANEFATVSVDGLARLWDRRVGSGSVSTLLDRQATGSGEPHALRCCDWHKGHDWMLAVGSEAGQVLVWDVRNTLQPLKRRGAHRGGGVACVKFGTGSGLDGLATCSTRDRTVRVWDTAGDGIYLTHEHRAHRGGVTHVDWDPHRPGVITSCATDGTVMCRPLDGITQVNERYIEGRLVTTKTAPTSRNDGGRISLDDTIIMAKL